MSLNKSNPSYRQKLFLASNKQCSNILCLCNRSLVISLLSSKFSQTKKVLPKLIICSCLKYDSGTWFIYYMLLIKHDIKNIPYLRQLIVISSLIRIVETFEIITWAHFYCPNTTRTLYCSNCRQLFYLVLFLNLLQAICLRKSVKNYTITLTTNV